MMWSIGRWGQAVGQLVTQHRSVRMRNRHSEPASHHAVPTSDSQCCRSSVIGCR